MLHNKFSSQSISENLGIDVSTVNRHYHHYQSSPNFDSYLATHYKPCVGKLSEEQKVLLKSYVKQNLCHCADQVRAYIEEAFKVIYTTSGVIALLHRLNFSYKQTRLNRVLTKQSKNVG